MTGNLVELLKDAETLEQVFKKFENWHVQECEFIQGKILSARKDYAIVDEINTWKPEIKAVHPYGTNIVYAFQKETQEETTLKEKEQLFFKSISSQD